MTTGRKRPERVAAQLRHELARQFARELGDPRLGGLIVSSVSMTPDLRLARVCWRLTVPLEPSELDARKKEIQGALSRASGRLRKAVTARLGLRFAPELHFEYDAEREARDRIEQLLDEVKRERGPETGEG